jgi:S1-C subfamily serine protease
MHWCNCQSALERWSKAFCLRALPKSAGLRRGDLVIEVDEKPVADPQALLEVVDAARLSEPLPLTVLRNGRELTLSVKPAPLPGLG